MANSGASGLQLSSRFLRLPLDLCRAGDPVFLSAPALIGKAMIEDGQEPSDEVLAGPLVPVLPSLLISIADYIIGGDAGI